MKNLKLFSVLFVVNISMQTHMSTAVTKTINGVEIRIEKGDITQYQAEAIVNAANPQLHAGAGVCGAIFAAASPENLQQACYQFPVLTTGDIRCPVGQACITDSFGLTKNGVKYIIHAVGPDCRIVKDEKEQDYLLRNAYSNALKVAENNKVSSIAFPFISSAIYAFPKERAADIALQEILGYMMKNTKLTAISFVLYSSEDYNLFVKRLEKAHTFLLKLVK